VLPDEASEALARVEDLLVEIAGRAPEELVEPALEALTAGGKRLRPILLVLSAGMGEPERSGLLTAATAVEVLHAATLIHDDVVDKAESRRGKPTTVARYGRETAVATGDYLFAETFTVWRRWETRGWCAPSPKRRWGSRRASWNSFALRAAPSRSRRTWSTSG
jgi:heptaprenyl diphosphate synthase